MSPVERQTLLRLINTDPVAWGERNFYIEDRVNPITGEELGPGPIILAEHQKRIMRAAFERDRQGRFRWTTIVDSEVKKSGKTRKAALAAAWLAQYAGAYAEVYCLANDGKQSADRVLAAVKKAIALGPTLKQWRDLKVKITLPSGAFIEAVPVDPTGEAGANPTGTFWSEMWGFRLSAKERLWTEFTIPPTRFGRAIRYVESYAGYVGESPVLEQLYDQGVNQGRRHPAFPELPVYINDRARLFCYWDHTPRMVWQTPEYYEAEAAILTENEFQRIHRNMWVSSEAQAIPIERWDACFDPNLPPLGPRAPIVIGVDLGVSGDLSALVVVSDHPFRKKKQPAIRAVEVFAAPLGEKIDYSTTIDLALRRWVANYNVVAIAYDEFQAHKMMTDLSRDPGVWCKPISQSKGSLIDPGRTVLDKMFYDMVIAGKLSHNGDPTLRQHVMNAISTGGATEKYLHFGKKAEKLHIDALVAASMGVGLHSQLNLQ